MTAERWPVGGGSCRGRPRAGSSSRCFLFGPLVPTYGCHRTIKCNPTEQGTDPAGTERACQMFTAKQYRAKAAEFKAFLTDTPRSLSEITEFRDLERIYTTLAENEEWMTIHLDKTIQRSKDRENRTALADEEEQILKCLGAALVMRWNTVPAKLQRELFDCASTIGDLLETMPPKGQIARFLHNHKNDRKVLARGPDSRKGQQIFSRQGGTR
jgi:hypothetical protein